VNKKFRLLFIILTAAILFVQISNIWRLDTLPFVDLPNHLAEAYLLRVLSAPDEPLKAFYRMDINFFTPGSLHAVFCSLFPDVEKGNKFFYTLYMMILVISMILLISMINGEIWAALLSALFLYNYSMMLGFAGFTMGIALVMLNMALLSQFLAKPSLARALSLTSLTLLLYYAHVLSFLFASTVILATVLSRRGFHVGHYLLGLSTLIPGLVLSGMWIGQSPAFGENSPLISFMTSYYSQEYLGSIPHRLIKILGNDNFRVAPGTQGAIIGSLFILSLVIVIAGLIWAALHSNGKDGNLWAHTRRMFENRTFFFKSKEPVVTRSWCHPGSVHTALVFILIAGLCYFILPDELPDQPVLYQRFSVFIFLGLVWITASLIPQNVRKPVLVFFALIVIAHSWVWFQYFSQFKETSQPFHDLLYNTTWSRGRTLSAIIEEPVKGDKTFRHYQNYQLIWNHGPVSTRITDYRFRIIQPQRKDLPPPYHDSLYGEIEYNKLIDGYRDMELLLVYGPKALSAVSSHGGYVEIARRRDWALFRKIPENRSR